MSNKVDVWMNSELRESRNRSWIPLALGVVMTVLASGAMAASSDAANSATQSQGQQLEGQLALNKGSKLIGKNIVDAQNKKLGEIKDMAIDLSNNRLDYIVVASDGVLGIGNKLYAVPAQIFGPFREDHDLVLNSSTQVLKASPIPDKNWLSAIDQNNLKLIYQHAGITLTDTGGGPSPQMVQATDMIGMGILTQQGEKAAADVKDFVVSMQDGRVPFAILSVGGPSGGISTKYVAVPTAALSKGPVRDRLYTSKSAQEINSAPELDKDHWLQALADPSRAAKIYVGYGVTPYWTQNPETAENRENNGQATQRQQPPQGVGGTSEEPPSQFLERKSLERSGPIQQ